MSKSLIAKTQFFWKHSHNRWFIMSVLVFLVSLGYFSRQFTFWASQEKSYQILYEKQFENKVMSNRIFSLEQVLKKILPDAETVYKQDRMLDDIQKILKDCKLDFTIKNIKPLPSQTVSSFEINKFQVTLEPVRGSQIEKLFRSISDFSPPMIISDLSMSRNNENEDTLTVNMTLHCWTRLE